MRAATESRIERDEDADSDIRARRSRRSAASEPRSRGARVNSWPGRRATKSSIQPTEITSWITCQKQAITPTTKTRPMIPLSHGLARKTPETSG